MDEDTQNPLPASLPDGRAASGMLGTVHVVPSQPLEPAALGLQPTAALFGDTLRLAGQAFPRFASLRMSSVPVRLLWEATRAPAADYTAFVHLIGPGGRQIGQDQPPAEGRAPTGAWLPGDRSLSVFVVSLPPDLPAGLYQVRVGVYPSATAGAERLPVTAEDLPVQDRSLVLGSLELR
jgi:hypothetical protein